MSLEHLTARYRVEDPYEDDGCPTLVRYYVVRKTPTGAWVAPQWAVLTYPLVTAAQSYEWMRLKLDELRARGCRFVLDGDGRRWAHESEEWARGSYKRRKHSQIKHANRSIERAKNGLHWLETGNSLQGEMFAFDAEANQRLF